MDYGVVISDTSGNLSLESGNSPKLLKGIDSLLQIVVIELTSDPDGRGGGSGFASSVRTTLPGDPNADAVFGQKIRTAEEHVLTSQQDVSLPLNEQLESLDLLSVTTDGIGWEIELMLVNRAGEQVTRVLNHNRSGSSGS